MDGNGRWAKQHRHNRIFGHIRGVKTARLIIQECSRRQIPFLSLFALSTENTLRPRQEVKGLKNLLEKALLKHSDLLMKEQIRIHFLGDLSIFSPSIKKLCQKLCRETKDHKGLNLIVALNYGGQQEILKAMKKIAEDLKQGTVQTKQLNEKLLSSYLDSSHFPPPDLIVRTGGQIRISNFYLWSAVYSEFYFTDTLWPDFNSKHLDKALKHFASAQRRFGRL